MKRIAVVLFVLLAACGADDDEPSTSTTTPTTSTTLTGSATTSTTASPFSNTAVSTPDTRPQVILAKLDVGEHSGFARVVFRFREDSATIGYAVAHAEPPFTSDGQGATVQVDGDGHIAVRIVGAAHDPESGQTSYPDGERVKGHDPITEVVRIGDFEGIVNFVIGTNGDRPFRVFTLQSPARLIIDVEA